MSNYKNKDGSRRGNPAIQVRAPQKLIDEFMDKCKQAGLDKSECLRQAMKEFKPKK